MGTRGFVGVYVDGETKGVYNHFDSYLEWLGLKIVKDISNIKETYPNINFIEKAKNWIAIDEESEPTPELIKQYKEHSDISVSSQKLSDWYCLLRNLQGKFVQHLAEVQHYVDSTEFLDDSLFCEWAYVWNMDDNKFEIYKGCQKEFHQEGRYAKKHPNEDGWFPVKLIHKISIDENLVENFTNFYQSYQKEEKDNDD